MRIEGSSFKKDKRGRTAKYVNYICRPHTLLPTILDRILVYTKPQGPEGIKEWFRKT